MQELTTIEPAPRRKLGAALRRFLMADVPPVNGNGRVVINMRPWTGWIAAILAVAALIWNQATWKTRVEHDVKDLKHAQPSVLKLVETSNSDPRLKS